MKKFFKILMVLALLSGAALSCTKDYSKEIADVQKQNQDLQALVASLQNALNSTNATVSQLNSTSDKQAADIAKIVSDINAQKGDISALMADVETIEALSEVFAQLGVDLSEEIEDQALLIAALQAQAKELEEGIETIDGKATANAAAIAKIDENLKGIASTLDLLEKGMTAIEANKIAIAANKTAIEAAQEEIEAIKEKIDKLSARLTNIVAAPAKNAEIQGIIFGEYKRSIIDMNFVVAPASAAEAIAAGNADVKLVLTNGISRKNESKPAVLNYTVTPDKVTAGENGIINVYAVEDTIFDVAKYGYNEKIYATLIVSGTDEAGDFERISDPVAAIDGGVGLISEYNFSWYKGDEAVPTVNSFTLFDEKFDHTVDSVVVLGRTLYYVAADKDWKTLPCTESDILKDYVLKTKIGDTALSIYEVADLFEIGREEVKPHFTAYDKKTFEYSWPTGICEWEWGGYAAYDDAKKVIAVTADSTSTKFDVKIELPEEKPEEAVGSVVTVRTNRIAFGELDTPYTVQFIQRIGKHVNEEEAADPQTIKFGINWTNVGWDASKVCQYLEAIEWKSTTQISYDDWYTTANLYTLGSDGKIGEKVEGVSVYVDKNKNNPKFVNLDLWNIPYAKEAKNYRIVLRNDAQKNKYGVAVLEHGDYIDLTVEPYHPAVEKTAKAVKDLFVSRNTHTAKFSTDLTVNGVLGDYKDWLINDVKIDADDSANVYNWYKNKALNGQFITEANTVKAKQGDVEVGTARLLLGAKDTICVEFTANKKFEEGKDVTVSVKDTIDGVIAFKYDFTFGTIKPEVSVATIPGFVKDGQIEVAGKEVNGKYTINDINLSQYFKFENVDKKHENDKISVKFSDDTTGLIYSGDSTYVIATGTKDAIQSDAKISWGTLKATSFVLTAQAQLEGAKVGDAVTVTVKTADPIKDIDDVKIEKELKGAAAKIDLFKENKKELKIFGILDAKNSIYPGNLEVYGGVEPTIAAMKDWKCTVNDVDYPNTQMQQLFSGITGSILSVKEHDALGTIVITIPCEFKYDFGKKEFDVILTIK